jgi:hydroxyacylglutathione hydrolase
MHGVFDYGQGISAVDAVYEREMQTAVHVVVQDGRAIVVDTATARAAPRVLAALQAKGVPPERVDYVVLTHVHLDHAGGAGQLLARCPNARLTVHPRGARHMIDPARLISATVAIYGEETTRRVYGEILPVDAARIVETPEGATLAWAGRELLFLDAPGHARHHVVVRDSRSGHFFAGDTFGLSYRELDLDGRQFSFPTTSPSQFDPERLHASIERIMSFHPEALYVAHFGQLRDLRRLAGDLHRLIDAHAALAQQHRAAGAERHARLREGVARIVAAESERQRWRLGSAQSESLFALDIELNAQGLAAWLDATAR